jgi:hypothetical protein
MTGTSPVMTSLRGGCCEKAQPISLNRTAVRMSRASTYLSSSEEHVDARDKPAHDESEGAAMLPVALRASRQHAPARAVHLTVEEGGYV